MESHSIKEKILLLAVNRILKAEKNAIIDLNSPSKSKFFTSLASSINPFIKKTVLHYIIDNLETRFDLALDWLYKEYAIFCGSQEQVASGLKLNEDLHYNSLFCGLASAIDLLQDGTRDILMARLYIEAPIIPDEAVEKLKSISTTVKGLATLTLLKDIALKRPAKHVTFLRVLLHHTGHQSMTIRQTATDLTVELYNQRRFRKVIEQHALLHVEYLRLPSPPYSLFGANRGREQVEHHWTESTVKLCLKLFLRILEKNFSLIHELEQVYSYMGLNVQRLVLKYTRVRLRILGIDSTLLLL